jgi:transposase
MTLAAAIRDAIDPLMRDIAQLRGEVACLRRENAALRAENAALRAENAGLRRRLDLDSSTSSKPPSSDGLKKKPRIPGSLRGRSGKPSGGQTGHTGDTLRQVAAPDRVVRHEAQACLHCRAGLTASMQRGVERRQVFDLPERLIEVTEHQAAIYLCAHCRGVTRAAFPEGVAWPAQYGERIRAAAIYLNAHQLIPEDRVAEAMSDLFGALRLCPDSVANWVRGKAAALAPVAAQIAALAAAAPVRCLDETGFRVAGKGHWLHTVATETLTCYRVSSQRGEMPEGLIGGVVVHDGFKSYSGLTDIGHALCNAHHLRELKALIEIDREPWAAPMRDLLLEASRAVEQAREEGADSLAPPVLEGLLARYWEILRLGLAFHRNLPRLQRHPSNRGRTKHRPGHNLLIRLHQFKDDALRFLSDFSVPFTNNLAEQALRMMKVKMKISGAFRTFEAACAFAVLRSVIATARKRGWNILQTLTARPPCLIHTPAA